ncbi:hypothetical protein WMY93_011179 [Mugilogobius chulae]|uniref:C2H2-type domain-containing protein n=1 Tax=Mugilogobius chulae TaxID=88201 RepID=A0AAW0P1Q0_9GOBI
MARDISELFDGMVALHEREIRVLKQRNMRQQHILESVLKPRVVLCRTDLQIPSGVDCQLDQETATEPIKEEQEQLSIKQEPEDLQEFTYNLTVKSEDEQLPVLYLSSPEEHNFEGNDRSDDSPHLHSDTDKMENFDLKDLKEKHSPGSSGHFQSDTQTQSSSDTDDSEWAPEIHSGRQNKDKSVNDEEIIFECSECLKTILRKGLSVKHAQGNSSKTKPLTCFACSVKSTGKTGKVRTGKKPFACKVCRKGFTREDNLNTHMLIHKVRMRQRLPELLTEEEGNETYTYLVYIVEPDGCFKFFILRKRKH